MGRMDFNRANIAASRIISSKAAPTFFSTNLLASFAEVA
jgi:hypothetical protein